MNKITLVSLAALAVSGCASVLLPPDQLQGVEASTRGAEELGAKDVPEARLHLELAKDETAAAKKMSLAGDERAPLMLARANADAELALGLARDVTVLAEAERADADLQAVQGRDMH